MSFEYIKEKGACGSAELETVINQQVIGGTMLAIYTDRVECETFSGINDSEHLLEVRIFTETAEFKAIRATMDKDFVWRLIDDDAFRTVVGESEFKNCTLNEKQYLDIDAQKSDFASGNYRTTGGGEYTLPVTDAEKLELRNYIIYNDDGVAKITDFRIVRILKKKEE